MVRCAVCKRLIPASEAISPEGRQYVLHLCGGACHAQWERECAESLEREFEARSGVKRD
jgi:hypothetical protein